MTECQHRWEPVEGQPKPEYKFCDDGKVILKNPEILSQRYRDTTQPVEGQPMYKCARCGAFMRIIK